MRICSSSTLEDAVYPLVGFVMNKAEDVEPPEGASQHMLLSYSSADCKRSDTSASNKGKVVRHATKSHCCIYSIVSTGAFWDVDTDRQVACKKSQSCKTKSVQEAKGI